MGTLTNATAFTEGGAPAPTSRGGKKYRRLIASCTFSNSYATGGDTLTVPSGYGTLKLVHVAPVFVAGVDRAYSWNNNTSTPKIMAIVISTGAEVANATDLSAVTVQVEAIFEQ